MPRLTVSDRLWTQVESSPLGCWIWRGDVTAKGYGRISIGGRSRLVHRVAHELLVGPIPEGLVIDHLCRNRACVNPAHLEPVTNRENTMRGTNHVAVNAHATHCKWGHEFTSENTYLRRDRTERVCRACKAARRAIPPTDRNNGRRMP